MSKTGKKDYLRNLKDNAAGLIISLSVLIIVSIVFSRFLMFVESRPGVILEDPLLALFDPIDLTYFTFGILYGAVLLSIISVFRNPRRLIIAIRAYIILLLIRMLMMYSVPLDPPEGYILLEDPFIQLFSDGIALTRDLFFSGHTSTMFLLFLAVPLRRVRYILFCGTICVGLFVILQHVHYSIDVFVAPFIAYASWRFSLKIWDKKGN